MSRFEYNICKNLWRAPALSVAAHRSTSVFSQQAQQAQLRSGSLDFQGQQRGVGEPRFGGYLVFHLPVYQRAARLLVRGHLHKYNYKLLKEFEIQSD